MITKINNKNRVRTFIAGVSYLLLLSLLLLSSACQSPSVPTQFTDIKKAPSIYPDYTDVTIPVNIAPLTFEMNDSCDEVVARFTVGDHELVCGGRAVQPEMDDWRELVNKAVGNKKDVNVEVYIRLGEEWWRYKPFHITVSADSIDPYISYRLISPSYVAYEELTLNQRCLENYDEKVMVNNMLCGKETTGQCVNCHNYQMYNPQRMQFHARQFHGGTVIAYDGKLSKINMRNDSILSAGVYPAWHPWLPLIVYSTNKTSQSFHTRNLNKIEVFDAVSDLIAYDVAKNEVTNIENQENEFEVFPVWAPDGKTVYYCSAHFEFRDTTSHEVEVVRNYREVKYNIYKKSFNPDTYQFGPRELVFQADSLNMSATLPRVSPDGRFLMFTMGHYGVFHRRDDGSYTRPFFAHIDANGKGSKPFELPQADPDYHRQFMKCYNIPEFMRGPVEVSPQEFASVLKASDGEPVKYVQKLRKNE